MSEKDNIQNVILGLANFFEKQAAEENAELVARLRDAFEQNEGLYESEVTLAFLHFGMFAAMPFVEKHGIADLKSKSYAECIYNGTLPHFVRNVIERNEGSVCSGDKESFVIHQIKKALITGENQSLLDVYKAEDGVTPDRIGTRTYWSPMSFKDTDQVLEEFDAWYRVETRCVLQEKEDSFERD